MRFPTDVTNQKRCPVCKKVGPGAHPPATPRPETASLSFLVTSESRGKGRVVCLGSDLMLGWDSGVCKSPRSRASLGASLFVARREGEEPGWGDGLQVEFCSTACLRRFLNAAVDELERRVATVEPEVRVARAKLDAGGSPDAEPGNGANSRA